MEASDHRDRAPITIFLMKVLLAGRRRGSVGRVGFVRPFPFPLRGAL